MQARLVTGYATSDIRSRCPACQQFANEGEPHRCPSGRHRDEFQNPVMEGNTVPLACKVPRSRKRGDR